MKNLLNKAALSFLLAAIALVAAVAFMVLPIVHAERSSELLNKQSMETTVTITGSLTLLEESSGASVESVKALLYLVPREDAHQTVSTIATQPDGEIGEGIIEYEWVRPGIRRLEFSEAAQIETRIHQPKVTSKAEYPLESLPASFLQYTQAGEEIDVNPEIIELARQLSQGKDDLYEIEFAFAEWVKENIKYDLTSLGADSVQKSSWVLKNREGVCDELTSLFISLNRASGIPARFVSGVAYTNVESFDYPWVSHAWAEVYFPDYGWVPFDISYGEFGYVDSSHITLQVSPDSKDSSASYSVSGRRVNFETGEIGIGVDVQSSEPTMGTGISILIEPFEDKVRFGSYNLMTITLDNGKGYYQAAELRFAETTRMKVAEPAGNGVMVLLKPYERKEIPVLVKVDKDLAPGYKYTFPFSAFIGGTNKTVYFDVYEQGKNYDESDFRDIIDRAAEASSSGSGASSLQLKCSIPAGNSRQESYQIGCTVSSEDSGFVEVCMLQQCSSVMIGKEDASRQAAVEVQEFSTPVLGEGVHSFEIGAVQGQERARDVVVFSVPDIPSVVFEDVQYPAFLEYNERGALSFTVNVNSSSLPKNPRVGVRHRYFSQEWSVSDLSSPVVFSLEIPGSGLNAGTNGITLYAEYRDEYDTAYTSEKQVDVELGNLTLVQKLLVWMNEAAYWVDSTLTSG